MNYPILKISLLAVGFVLMIALVSVSIVTRKNYEIPEDLCYTISTIPLPENVKNVEHAIYTPNNKIMFCYLDGNTNQHHIGIIDDDGKNLHNIYNGEIAVDKGANGVRLMPFADNKRVLLGDYILETEPDFDNCDATNSKILRIKYPDEITGDRRFIFRWTEIIIAPDNVHMGWTSIAYTSGTTTSINFMGKLAKNSTGNGYDILDSQIISDFVFAYEDPEKPGFLKTIDYIHGGEIKQFTAGGTKITLAGAVKQGMSRSIVQDLKSSVTYALSQEPGYEETTIISPDGKLGIAMSTRFSPQSNCAILGLLPRPNSVYTLMGMNRYAYAYSVTQVRTSRVGNVGPALFEIEKAINDRNYHGYDLHDPSDNQVWVFKSPMSWHQSSAKAIWPEVHRINRTVRIRKIVINTDSYYTPGEPEKAVETPDDIPYALPLSALQNIPSFEMKGTFEGVNGFMDYDRKSDDIYTTYRDYSIDGKVFANGFEHFNLDSSTGEVTYTGNVTLSGSDSGSMDFKLTFSKDTVLLKDRSYGYASYDGKIIKVEDMVE